MFGFAETGSASISPAGGFGIFTLTTLIGLLVTARAWMSESSYRTLTSTVAGPAT